MTRNDDAHDNGTPGAELPKFSVNVVPTDQLRLMKYDHAAHVHAEADFQAELSRRIQESDASSEAGMTTEELAESLGPLGQQWADDYRAAQQKNPHE
ncbi:hypothetical protein [Streptomyces sp. NBC_01439]|uniref:hypothetical protein n=1 Tax=Streptomyces sp. NBC_01439 TaxID=2903867 RepID=UPI002E281673|nr:hypothetical protein [Streptomyces sp. NBC_01439]